MKLLNHSFYYNCHAVFYFLIFDDVPKLDSVLHQFHNIRCAICHACEISFIIKFWDLSHPTSDFFVYIFQLRKIISSILFTMEIVAKTSMLTPHKISLLILIEAYWEIIEADSTTPEKLESLLFFLIEKISVLISYYEGSR